LESGPRYIERISKGEAEIEKVQKNEEIIEEKFGSKAENLAIDEILIDYGKSQPNPQ